MKKSFELELTDSKFESVQTVQKSEPAQPVFLNTCFDKSQVKNLVSWVLENCGEKKTLSFLESLKSMGFHQATQAGISLGIDDLEIPPEKTDLISQTTAEMKFIEQQSTSGSRTSVEKSQFLIDTWNQTSEQLRHNAVQNFKNHNILNPVYMMAFSGARGNISQVRQLVAMRGLMADPQGAILEFPIQSNFREGLTITEYLISCYGARKGLVDTALRTATSGYLTRRLVDSAQHAVVSMIDCETDQGIQLHGKNIESRLIGRVLSKSVEIDSENILERNTLISLNIAQQLNSVKKPIFIRSPLTCESQTTVCQLCYGTNLATGTLVTLGEAVGVIAAQSIGEPGTQLTMRTFHTGGVGVFSEQAMKPIIAPYEGYLEYLESLSGHFVRTPHGSIRYMVKHISKNSSQKIVKIRPINSTTEEFFISESDLPPGSLLVVKQGEYVAAKQLIAQSSQLQLKQQKFPESSHPVYSPCEGQVFFESMRLTVEKQFIQRGKEHEKEIRFLEAEGIVPPKQENQKTSFPIGKGLPDIRTMTQIGTFWVLEAENRKEVQNSLPFLKIGDLVSSNSVLFYYNIYLKQQKELYKIKNQLTIGNFAFKFPVSSINFQNFVYQFRLKNSINDLFLYKTLASNSFQELAFIWYPSFNINSLQKDQKQSLIKKSDVFYLAKYNSYTLSDKEVVEDDNYRRKDISLQGNFLTLNEPLIKLKNPKFSKFIQNIPRVNSDSLPLSRVSSIPQNFQKVNNLYISINGRTQIIRNILNCLPNKKFKNTTKIKNPKNIKLKNSDMSFLIQISKKIHNKLSLNSFISTQEKTGWIVVPTFTNSLITSQISGRFFKPGGINQKNFVFSKQNTLIEYIPATKLIWIQKNFPSSTWYNSTNIITFNNNWLENSNKKLDISPLSLRSRYIIKPKVWYSFCQKNPRKIEQKSIKKSSFNTTFQTQQFFISIKKLKNKRIYTNKEIYSHWTRLQNENKKEQTKNICFSKQTATTFQISSTKALNFYLHPPILNDWFTTEIPLKVTGQKFENSIFNYSENSTDFGFQKQTIQPQFSLFCYNILALKNLKSLRFQTFRKNWVSPIFEITKGYIPTQTYGEFHSLESTPNGTTTSILINSNFITLEIRKIKNNNNPSCLTIGSVLRRGEEFSSGLCSSYNGQVTKCTQTKLTLRLGIPFLASARGLVHIFQNQIVRKNQLLLTLKSRRLQTEDIVQGIPKIEQLFEARESQGGEILQDTVHTRLQSYFVSELQHLNGQHWSIAVQKSFLQAQYFLVEEIINAYGNQGVKISEKHVEVIVRQMTSRVRILDGGDTGFLPGELVNHQRIQIFNKQLQENNLREATYEPIVLGISKSVLQSDSFLLAASFQEVSRVLVKSALSKKRDFLRGLHENVIVGQVIPAGTGLLSQTGIPALDLEQKFKTNRYLTRS